MNEEWKPPSVSVGDVVLWHYGHTRALRVMRRSGRLVGCLPSGWPFGSAGLPSAAFVNFPLIYNRFFRGGDAEAHSVAPDGNDGDGDIAVNDDSLSYFAREHKHSSSPA